jgi:prepilin-type N-terminal cleavage/methylation domain-containing protein
MNLQTKRLKSERGFSLVELLVASAIIATSALGLGTAIRHLLISREKTQTISQAIGIEGSLVAALQDPTTYAPTGANSKVLAAMRAGSSNPPQPTITVTVSAADAKVPQVFKIVAGGAPVYLDKNAKVISVGSGNSTSTNWYTKLSLSPLAKIGNHYSYNYQLQINPNLGVLASLGFSKTLTAPTTDEASIIIPAETLALADRATANMSCDPETSLAMLGIDQGGKPICIERAKNSCSSKAIPKSFRLVQQSTSPLSYSYEFRCQRLHVLSCPDKLNIGGVPDASLTNPYALQSFIPNTLDSSGDLDGTGTCVFVASKTVTHTEGPFQDGVSFAAACPLHYTLNAASVKCNAGTDDPVAPATVTCVKNKPAVPVKPGKTVAKVSGGVITCQRAVTQVCCGDDPTRCAGIWSGTVSVTYTCGLDANVTETVPAISN